MDRPDSSRPKPVISDRVLINGTVMPVTLFADEVLRWTERGHQSLIVEKEVLGFKVEGPKIKIRALVDGGDGIYCVGSRVGAVARKDLVFEPLSEDSQRLWCRSFRIHRISRKAEEAVCFCESIWREQICFEDIS